MPKILLIDIDSKIPNVALNKIALYHQEKGYEIVWGKANLCDDLFFSARPYESVWVSCVFSNNQPAAQKWADLHPTVYIGGSGVDINIALPPEIDCMKPKINYGFTSRGCPRKCQFCVVPKKEGFVHPVGDIYDFWDGKSKSIALLDNNILALPKHFFKVTDQLIKEGLKVNFNQGLDCRLVTPEIARRLKEVRHLNRYLFAFDSMAVKPFVLRAISTLKEAGINSCRWYVLIGFDTTPKEDYERIETLRQLNQFVYPMPYNRDPSSRFFSPIIKYCNYHDNYFRTMTLIQFLNKTISGEIKSIYVNHAKTWLDAITK